MFINRCFEQTVNRIYRDRTFSFKKKKRKRKEQSLVFRNIFATAYLLEAHNNQTLASGRNTLFTRSSFLKHIFSYVSKEIYVAKLSWLLNNFGLYNSLLNEIFHGQKIVIEYSEKFTFFSRIFRRVTSYRSMHSICFRKNPVSLKGLEKCRMEKTYIFRQKNFK